MPSSKLSRQASAWPAALAGVVALVSLAAPTPIGWAVARAVLFVLVAGLGRPNLGYSGAALAMIAALGFDGMDFALACLAAGSLRISREHLGWIAMGAGIICAAAMPINRNHFAVFTELLLPFLVWRGVRENLRFPLVVAGGLLAVCFATGSRAGAAVLAIEIGWLAWMVGGFKRVAVAGLTLGLLASIFLLSSQGPRMTNFWAGDHRREIWQSAFEMICAKPLGGWGSQQFPQAYPAFARFDNGQFVNAAHSDWLEWAVEYGVWAPLVGAGALVFYLARFHYSLPVWGILFGAIHAAVDYPWHQPGFLCFTVILAASYATYAQKSAHSHSAPT